MYGLPIDEDFKFFLGLEVAQVCIGRHDMILHFDDAVPVDDAVTVTVEGDLGVRAVGGSERIFGDYREAAADTVKIIGLSVIRVEKGEEGDLSLHFAGGAALTFYDSVEHYESYQIQRGEKIYVI
jgi:hypothetical protein